MNDNKINALRLIAAKSPNAMREAIKTIQAIDLNSPVAQRRYNHVVEIALNDPQADFSAEERATIVGELDTVESSGRSTIYGEPMRQTAIYLPETMTSWLLSQPGNMSETVRGLIQKKMEEEMENVKYHLSSSMSDRIKFDADMKEYIENCLSSLDADELSLVTADNYFDEDQLSVDDSEEARARFNNIFSEVVRSREQ